MTHTTSKKRLAKNWIGQKRIGPNWPNQDGQSQSRSLPRGLGKPYLSIHSYRSSRVWMPQTRMTSDSASQPTQWQAPLMVVPATDVDSTCCPEFINHETTAQSWSPAASGPHEWHVENRPLLPSSDSICQTWHNLRSSVDITSHM